MTNRYRTIVRTPVLAAGTDDTIEGLLLPFGEIGRTNAGQFTVEAAEVTLPEDPSVISLNVDHDRFQPVGRAVTASIRPDGVYARFQYANTAAARVALQEAKNGTRACLSAEFTVEDFVNGKAKGVKVAAAAQCPKGAFPSARVLAAATDGEVTDANGETWEVIDTDEPIDPSKPAVLIQPENPENAAPLEEEAEENQDPEKEVTPVTATRTPAHLRANAPAGTTQPRGPQLREIFAAIAEVKSAPFATNTHAHEVLAALSDIKISGAGSLPVGGDAIQPSWLGQLYQGVPYEREYITLGTLGTDIHAAGKKGYTVNRGTTAAPVNNFAGNWNGNKADIPSGVGFTASKTSTLARFAFGADIAREFYDLPGGEEVVEAFLSLVVEDYMVWSDNIARSAIITAAGAAILPKAAPVVGTYTYPPALAALITAYLAARKKKADGRKDVPTFAMVNEFTFEQLVMTPKDQLPEFVKFTASTDWTGEGDGLKLVVADTGQNTKLDVVCGAAKGIQFDELAGGPLHINALDLAKGGVDKAVHGYVQTFVQRPEAFVRVTAA